jgi:hypothetical protein
MDELKTKRRKKGKVSRHDGMIEFIGNKEEETNSSKLRGLVG